MSHELCGALKVGGFMQCCGLDLGKDWDCFELCCPDEDSLERCPKPATCTYDNGTERIPLCPEHYDAWCRHEAETGDGTSPVWWSQEWLEKYEHGWGAPVIDQSRFRQATAWPSNKQQGGCARING